eukprot:PITA_13678
MDESTSEGLSLSLRLSNVNGSPLQLRLGLSEGGSKRSAGEPSAPIHPVADANILTLRSAEELGNGRAEEEGGSREQCALLEETFQKNRVPEPVQKVELAQELNLRTHQVDVWFQNRRARSKLKQTEVDCEVLRRDNEALVDDNRKLHIEVEKLKARITMCPSCARVSAANNSCS